MKCSNGLPWNKIVLPPVHLQTRLLADKAPGYCLLLTAYLCISSCSLIHRIIIPIIFTRGSGMKLDSGNGLIFRIAQARQHFEHSLSDMFRILVFIYLDILLFFVREVVGADYDLLLDGRVSCNACTACHFASQSRPEPGSRGKFRDAHFDASLSKIW